MIRFIIGRNGQVKEQKQKDVKKPLNSKNAKSRAPVEKPVEYSSDEDDDRFVFELKSTVAPTTTAVSSSSANANISKTSSKANKVEAVPASTSTTTVNEHEIHLQINEKSIEKDESILFMSELAPAFAEIVKNDRNTEKTIAQTSALLFAYLKAVNVPVAEEMPSFKYIMQLVAQLLQHVNTQQLKSAKAAQQLSTFQKDNIILKEMLSTKLPQLQTIIVKAATVNETIGNARVLSSSRDGESQTATAVCDSEMQSEPWQDPQIPILEAEKSRLNLQFENLKVENEQLNEIHSMKIKEFTLLKSEFSELKQDLTSEIEKTRQLTSKNEQQTSKILELTSEINQLNHKSNENIQNLSDKCAENKQLMQEKMDTFKQFRQLNQLFDSLTEKSQRLEAENGQNLEKIGQIIAENDSLIRAKEALLVAKESARKQASNLATVVGQIEQQLTYLKSEKGSLAVKLEETEKKLEKSSKKALNLQQQVDSLVKCPDVSLGQEERHLAVTSTEFDSQVKQFIQTNLLRIMVLERKNSEYRKMRNEHAQIAATNKKIELSNPQKLYNQQSIREIVDYLDGNKLDNYITAARPIRSALSAGKRGATPKSVKWDEEFF